MTSGYPDEDCSLDIEGYLSPNNLQFPQKEKQLDTIPEDESGYLLVYSGYIQDEQLPEEV